MTKKLSQSLLAKAASERWSLSLNNLEHLLFYLLLLFLPTQLGLHFWPSFAYVSGVRIDYLSPTLYLTDILISILFFVWLINRREKIKINIYFVFFFALVFIGVFLSKNIGAGIYGLLKLFEFIFLGYYVYKYVKIDRIFLKIVSIGIIFESFLGIAQFLNKSSLGLFYFLGERSFNSQTPNIANASIGGQLILRPYATFSHPNILAGFLLISLAFVLLFIKTRNNLEKFFYTAVVLLGATCLILTLGRTAILGFVILVIYKFLLLLKTKSTKNIIYLFVLIITMFLTAAPFLPRFTTFSLTDVSFIKRKELIDASLVMIKDNPVFGVGINNYLPNLSSYLHLKDSVFYLQPVHNIFLLAISQIGIIAGILFVILLFKAFRTASPNLKFILLLVCLLGFFDHFFLTLQQGQILLALVLGLSFTKTGKSGNLLK